MARLIVGIGQVAYIGPIETVPTHRCVVPVIGAGLDREFELTTSRGRHKSRLQLVASRVERSVNAFGGRLAVIALDPGTRFCRNWDQRRSLDALRSLADVFSDENWHKLTSALGISPNPQGLPDDVRRVCDLISGNLEKNLLAINLAQHVGLSVSRLEHLFAASLGVPLRSYRTWYRFRSVANDLACNRNLTEAAHRAGFHDSAHFSNTFSRMFGLPPSAIFTRSLQIHLPAGLPST